MQTIQLFLLILFLSRSLTGNAACTCNQANGFKAARSTPYSAYAPSLGNPVFDVAQLSTQLLADSKNIPHKIAMVFTCMHNAYVSRTPSRLPVDQAAAAGHEALVHILESETEKLLLLKARMDHLRIPRAAAEIVADTFLRHPLTPVDGPDAYTPTNPPSDKYDASCTTIRVGDKWQAQCVQSKRGMPCVPQKVSLASMRNASLISFAGARAAHILIQGFPAPPAYTGSLSTLEINDTSRFATQYRTVLSASAELDDRKKYLSEFFRPNSAWMIANVALGESIARNLTAERTLKLLFAATAATRDAYVAAATVKLMHESARPLSVIQCAWGDADVAAWRGPYLGVGRQDSTWQPYLRTSPHPGYVSGASTMSAAGAAVLQRFFGEDVVRGANCAVQKAGMSGTEPRVEKGSFGYMAGLTDMPNTGLGSVGYSPAADVQICWASFSQLASFVAMSRVFAGIHIPADSWMGAELGKRIANFAYNFTMEA